jgi:hypothetical protein
MITPLQAAPRNYELLAQGIAPKNEERANAMLNVWRQGGVARKK